jgi:DNA-binding NarL/FixJ family response regulator
VIRIVLVDDQTLLRQGLRGLLELTDDLAVTGEASDGEEALQLLRREPPDVVLLDVRMPRRSGIEVLEALRDEHRHVPAILLTTFDDDEALARGLAAGAKGWLLKDVSFERLTEAVRTVAAGGSLVTPALTDRILRGLTALRKGGADDGSPEPLTRREVEIVRLLAAGQSNREIAELSGTSEGTVKNQVSSILAKLGVRDRTRAVLKAVDLGLL